MNPELAIVADRVRQRRAAHDARELQRLPPEHSSAATSARALQAGARVFDLVTGQEGEIVGRSREDFIVQPAE